AAATAPPSTSGMAGRSNCSLKKTSSAHVGGPNAGSRLTAKITASASRYSLMERVQARRYAHASDERAELICNQDPAGGRSRGGSQRPQDAARGRVRLRGGRRGRRRRIRGAKGSRA